MNQLDKIFEGTKGAAEFAKMYSKHVSGLLESLDFDAIDAVTQCFLKAREEGKKIFFIGNGGSAATASHFANDFSIGPRCPEKPFKAVSLTDNVAVISAIANDFSYEDVFFKQLEVLMEPGDVVVAISASGNSPNVLKAIEYANEKGNTTIGLTGFSGGKLKEISNININVETAKGEYGPVEDVHMFIDHLIGSYVNRAIFAG